MEATVQECCIEVYDLITCQMSGLRRIHDTLFDSGDVFLGYCAADGLVVKRNACAGLCGCKLDDDMGVLTVATGLTCIARLYLY